MLNVLGWLKYINKISITGFFLLLLVVATRKFKIRYVARIVFLLDSAQTEPLHGGRVPMPSAYLFLFV